MNSPVNSRVRVDMDGPVARVCLTRPDQHNGMDFAMLDAVRRAARRLGKDRRVRAVILHGEGPSFCAGLDVKSVLGTPAAAAVGLASLFSPVRNRFQEWSMAWREVAAPVIAAIHGNCFGAGLQLALGADIRLATPDARLSVMEVKWGLVPDMGGAALLRELVSLDVAKELAMTGRIISGTEAHALRLVTRVTEAPLEQDPQAGRAQAHEPSRHLGVDQVARTDAAGALEDLQVPGCEPPPVEVRRDVGALEDDPLTPVIVTGAAGG